MALRTLYQTLLDSDPARLRVIAQQWHITLSSSRKADMAAELVNTMASNEKVTHLLDHLTVEERTALNDLLRNGNALPWATYIRRWGEVRILGAGRVEREELWRDPVSAAESLWFLGLVQRAFEDLNGQPVERAFVPEELVLYMPPPPPLDIPDPPTTSPPTHSEHGTNTLADDLVTLWASLHQQRVTAATPPGEMHAPEPLRRSLVQTLSVEQGWLRRNGQGQLRPVPKPILNWLRADRWTQEATLARAWMESQQWQDVARVPQIEPDPTQDWPKASLSARQVILDIVKRCTPETWYDMHAFVGYVKQHSTDFLRPDGNYKTWAPRDATTGKPLRGFEAWDAVEGALIEFIITGPLTWLGMVDLGGPAEGGPWRAFRLTEAGAALLELAPAPAQPTPPPVTIDATATLDVPSHRRYERFQLSRIAESMGSAGAYRYRLTPASLSRARQQNIPLTRILEFLNEATDHDVSDKIEAAIRQAYEGYGARVDRVWLLRLPDPELSQLPALQNLVVEVISADLVVIRAEDREHVLKTLLNQGVLLDVSEN